MIGAACRGGQPSSLSLKTEKAKLFIAKDYVNNICESDIPFVDKIEHSSSKTRLLLRSYARNISMFATNTALINDINANENLSGALFYEYLDALKRLYVLEDIEARCANICSKTSIRSFNKLEIIDPSIAVAALGLFPEYLETDKTLLVWLLYNKILKSLPIFYR